MDLSGTVKTPLGNVQKKTALLVGGGVVVILGIIWYRQKKNDKSAAGANTGINPATGYAYGSEEDAAALANQAAYVTPAGAGGGGGGGGGTGNAGFTSNAQWTQATISGMVSAGIIEDSTLLSAALGRYITGQPAGDLRTLIEQAIAFSGLPPVAGPNGYPPSINTSNPTPAPPNPTPDPTPTPTPTPVARPQSLVAPANTNLYDWSQSVESQYNIHDYMVITRCEETGKVRWRPTNDPNGNPQFDAPTTVRLG